MTGTELLEALRQAVPALPVAVMTAHVAIGAAMESLRRSADAFLEKPVPPARLIAVASALIAGRRPVPQSEPVRRKTRDAGSAAP
jgi:DNA-binding NtrC family response regulator